MDLSRLLEPNQPFPRVAVLVARKDGSPHSGVFFLNEGNPTVLDQQWHNITKYQPVQDSYQHFDKCLLLARPDILREREILLVGICKMVMKLIDQDAMKIPYAFRTDLQARFDTKTGRLSMPDGRGLSCAGFTIIVFQSADVDLIDFNEWPSRDTDRQRHEELVDIMKYFNVDSAQIDLLEQEEMDSLRASPEEVAGAALCELPANHEIAIPAGEKVSERLDLIETQNK